MGNYTNSYDMAYKLYQMYKPRPDHIEENEGIEMYSYERPAGLFWQLFIEGLMEKGATDDEAQLVIQSKLVRHMLDHPSAEFEQAVKDMATMEMVEKARQWVVNGDV